MNYVKMTNSGEEISITNEWLHYQAKNGNFIPLIKALRILSGMGLKDSKDGVENNCRDVGMKLSPKKTLEYFSKWMTQKNIETVIQREQAKMEEIQKETQNRIAIEQERRHLEHKAREIQDKLQADADNARKLDQDRKETNAILFAIECICTHWQTLGFRSKLSGCNTVLTNFEYEVPKRLA